jgi:hypothetical protein
MEQVVSLMQKPAPKHVMDGLCQRLKEIESNETQRGLQIADECRKYIYGQDEILWMHVLVSAYYINGGIMLREAIQSSTTSHDGSVVAKNKTECPSCHDQGDSHQADSSSDNNKDACRQVQKHASDSKSHPKNKESSLKESSLKESSGKESHGKEALKNASCSGPVLDVHIPEMLEMEEMIRSMNM